MDDKGSRTPSGSWIRGRLLPRTATTPSRDALAAEPAEIVILFSNRRPVRLRGIVSRAIATTMTSQILRFPGSTILTELFDIPTHAAVSIEVVPDGTGPREAQNLVMRGEDARRLRLSGEEFLNGRIHHAPNGATVAQPGMPAAPAASAPLILHVDDCEDDRELFARAFARSGLKGILMSVAGTAEAMNFLQQSEATREHPRPRLIVLDLNLPRFDGIDFLDVLRASATFKTIPVIILSGSDSHANMDRCRELIIEDYVVKPTTQRGLAEFIEALSHWIVGTATRHSASTKHPQ